MYLPSFSARAPSAAGEARGLDGSPSQLDRGRTPRSWSFARTAPPRLCRIDQRDSRRCSRDEIPLRKSRPGSRDIIQISRRLEILIVAFVAARESFQGFDSRSSREKFQRRFPFAPLYDRGRVNSWKKCGSEWKTGRCSSFQTRSRFYLQRREAPVDRVASCTYLRL